MYYTLHFFRLWVNTKLKAVIRMCISYMGLLTGIEEAATVKCNGLQALKFIGLFMFPRPNTCVTEVILYRNNKIRDR
jgi:hypothetical protein